MFIFFNALALAWRLITTVTVADAFMVTVGSRKTAVVRFHDVLFIVVCKCSVERERAGERMKEVCVCVCVGVCLPCVYMFGSFGCGWVCVCVCRSVG